MLRYLGRDTSADLVVLYDPEPDVELGMLQRMVGVLTERYGNQSTVNPSEIRDVISVSLALVARNGGQFDLLGTVKLGQELQERSIRKSYEALVPGSLVKEGTYLLHPDDRYVRAHGPREMYAHLPDSGWCIDISRFDWEIESQQRRRLVSSSEWDALLNERLS